MLVYRGYVSLGAVSEDNSQKDKISKPDKDKFRKIVSRKHYWSPTAATFNSLLVVCVTSVCRQYTDISKSTRLALNKVGYDAELCTSFESILKSVVEGNKMLLVILILVVMFYTTNNHLFDEYEYNS